jgi:hypothetical protein
VSRQEGEENGVIGLWVLAKDTMQEPSELTDRSRGSRTVFGSRGSIRCFRKILEVVVMVRILFFRKLEVTAPIVGQLGRLVPAIHTTPISITHMTNDSIEELLQHPDTRVSGGINLFHHQLRALGAVFVDLEGVGVNKSLRPLGGLERGVDLELWS